MRYCGLGGKLNYDDELVQGNPSEGKFVAYYFKDNKVVAVASMGRDPVVMKCSELMRLGKMPTAEQIKSGHVSHFHSIFECMLTHFTGYPYR
jgi:hypothetical protein